MNIEEKLWEYIDGTASEADKSYVEEMLRTHAEWKAKYAELLDVHQLVQNHLDLEQPSMRFTQNVMEEISRFYISPAASSYINKNIIRGIGLFFITMIVGLLGYVFGQVNWKEASASENTLFKMPGYDWSNFVNSTYLNIFIMINIVLGLMLLDMYLRGKKRQMPDEGTGKQH